MNAQPYGRGFPCKGKGATKSPQGKSQISFATQLYRIKQAVSPAEFYRTELPGPLKWKRDCGWVDGGLCPFHADTHTGSFRVNLDTGAFYCFACKAKGGDVIAFMMLRDGISCAEALAVLRDTWG